jgi:hypothetical protein
MVSSFVLGAIAATPRPMPAVALVRTILTTNVVTAALDLAPQTRRPAGKS